MSRLMWLVLSATAILGMGATAQAGTIDLYLVGWANSPAISFHDNGSSWNLGIPSAVLLPLTEFAPNNIQVLPGITSIEFHGVGPLEIPPGDDPILQSLPSLLTFTTPEGNFVFDGLSAFADDVQDASSDSPALKGWGSLGMLSGPNQTPTLAGFVVLFNVDANDPMWAWFLFTAPALIPEPSSLLLALVGSVWMLVRQKRLADSRKSATASA